MEKWIVKGKQSGVASIEFVMGFMAFWWMCMAWVEAGVISHVSAMTDLAVSEAARTSKLQDTLTCDPVNDTGCNNHYVTLFSQVLKSSDSVWSDFVDVNRFSISITYLTDLKSVLDFDPECDPLEPSCKPINTTDPREQAIAIYKIDYAYTPMFNFFLNSDSIFSREAIVIQEYERSEFMF